MLARRSHFWVTFVVVAVASGSFALMQSMTVPVMPEIEAELGTDQSTVTWVLTAYLLAASVATPIVGRLGDAWGKQRMMVFSLAMLSVGSLVAALAPTIEVMIAARVVQGFGGGVMPLAFGIIRDEFPEQRVATGVSFVSSLTAVGFGAGIVLSGPIVDGLGYAWLFWLPMIVTGACAVAAFVVVPESPVRTPGRVPLLPAVVLAGWLVCLLLALSQAPTWGWGSPAVPSLLGASAVLVAAWVRVEHRVRVPLIDMRMMRLRGVWTTNLVALLVGVAMYASFGFMPQFNQTDPSAGFGFGASITESGLMMLPNAIGSFVCGLLGAPVARVVGAKVVVVAGSLLAAGGMAHFVLRHDTIGDMLVTATMLGFGIGVVFTSLAPLIVGAVTPQQTGVATGMNANIRTIGGAIGTAVMSTIVTSHTRPDGGAAESGYLLGFAVLGGVMLLTAVAALAIPGVSGRRLDARLSAPSAARPSELITTR